LKSQKFYQIKNKKLNDYYLFILNYQKKKLN